MISENWDRRFLSLAEHIAQWSKDPSTKVGAVLVNENRIVVGMGYNGFARGVVDSHERLTDRDLKYKFVVHAEVNAILQAGANARGAHLYVWPSFLIPCICHECAKVACQAGVKEVVGYHPDRERAERGARWADSIAVAKAMLDESGVGYRGI